MLCPAVACSDAYPEAGMYFLLDYDFCFLLRDYMHGIIPKTGAAFEPLR